MSTLPIFGPKARFFDADGAPLAGGKVLTYSAGTTTPLATYTTRAGSVANSNPVILDDNGEADIWGTPGLLYKIRLTNSLNVIQWTVDNVPVGSAEASSSDSANTVDPGGRLTLTSAFPVPSTDVTNATSILYTAHLHNKVPIYDGSAWTLATFGAELSQLLSDTTKSPAAAADGNEYDMFIWLDSGTLRLSRGPAWSTDLARGTGAGTTELERVDGRHVNANAISNGPDAQCGLYVGTIRVATGGCSDSIAKRHVWNAYHRMPRPMQATDATTSWSYTTDTWRQANGAAANQLDFVIGLSRELVRADVIASVNHISSNTIHIAQFQVGIGLDSSTVNSAAISAGQSHNPDVAVSNETFLLTAIYAGFPDIGRHTLAWLERATQIGGTTAWQGTDTSGTGQTSGIIGNLFA